MRAYKEPDIKSAEFLAVRMLSSRSVNNKSMNIYDFIVDNDFDIVLIN